jgi:hypothetical protein
VVSNDLETVLIFYNILFNEISPISIEIKRFWKKCIE